MSTVPFGGGHRLAVDVLARGSAAASPLLVARLLVGVGLAPELVALARHAAQVAAVAEDAACVDVDEIALLRGVQTAVAVDDVLPLAAHALQRRVLAPQQVLKVVHGYSREWCLPDRNIYIQTQERVRTHACPCRSGEWPCARRCGARPSSVGTPPSPRDTGASRPCRSGTAATPGSLRRNRS